MPETHEHELGLVIVCRHDLDTIHEQHPPVLCSPKSSSHVLLSSVMGRGGVCFSTPLTYLPPGETPRDIPQDRSSSSLSWLFWSSPCGDLLPMAGVEMTLGVHGRHGIALVCE